MKSVWIFSILLCAMVSTLMASPATILPTQGGVPKDPSARILNTWLALNVIENGMEGVRFRLHFEIRGMQNRECNAVIYFYSKNGTPLKDRNGRFNTAEGNVATGKKFTPPYPVSSKKDLDIFIPYVELHTSDFQRLKYKVIIWGDGSRLCEWYGEFLYSSQFVAPKPGDSPRN